MAPDLAPATRAIVKPGQISNGERYRLHIEVTRNRNRAFIKATLNGRQFVNWRGPENTLGSVPQWALPCPQAVGIHVPGKSVADIHKVELTVKRDGTALQLGEDFKNPLSVVDAAPPDEISAECLEWNGRHYFISETPLDIVAAQQLASVLKGRLLTISSTEEEAMIQKQARGIELWMSAWRHSGSKVWRDERNRPLRYVGRWAPRQPELLYYQHQLVLLTASGRANGWHDAKIFNRKHACIEWGEEYTDTK